MNGQPRSARYPKMVASALRLYLRHLAHREAAAPELDRAVLVAKRSRLASLPRYLDPDYIEQVIASFDPETSGSRRHLAPGQSKRKSPN